MRISGRRISEVTNVSRLAECARDKLAQLREGTSLESMWARLALESLAAGTIVEPETAALRRLTAPDRVWAGVEPWPPEAGWYRMDAVYRAHRLAIVRSDVEWLTELDACWDVGFRDAFASQLRAQGEIGLALAPAGPRPFGWTAEDVSILIGSDVMRDDVSVDRSWIALAAGDLTAARHALTEYQDFLVGLAKQWMIEPEKGVVEVLAHPDLVLQTERRALEALLRRRGVSTRDSTNAGRC